MLLSEVLCNFKNRLLSLKLQIMQSFLILNCHFDVSDCSQTHAGQAGEGDVSPPAHFAWRTLATPSLMTRTNVW